MASEIKLIHEIEQRPSLYNYTLNEYNKKEILEQAWAEIAMACQMSVAESKDKWKNIRSSYVRSLKESTNKVRKPYYLSSYLQFITPFLKTIDNVNENEEDSADNNGSDSDMSLLTAIKEEPLEIEVTPLENHYENRTKTNTNSSTNTNAHASTSIDTSKNTNSSSIEMEVTQPNVLTINPRGTEMKKKKRTMATLNHAPVPTKRTVSHPHRVATARPEIEYPNPMKLFLLSLLPEFDTMTTFQIRLFKIKVMMLIDDINSNVGEDMQESLSSVYRENVRLQKRLINLLLRNLEKKEKKS